MKKIIRNSVIIILILLLLIGYWNYYVPYSDGERKGKLIKITRKGNIFKTFEGEVWLSCRPITEPERFYFTVSDKAVADSLMKLQDECLSLTYKQYRKSLFWRGDSEYIVTGFQRITE